MRAALAAAETGHLVLCTMHTGTAPESVDRIIGSFEGAAQAEVRTQLAQSLIGVVCLRLVRRTSRPGRVVAAEVLLASDAVRGAIRESKAHHLRNIIATSGSCGMQTMEAHLSELLLQGEIDYGTALEVTERPDEIHVLGRSA
jgi:twitching motility protein PilT